MLRRAWLTLMGGVLLLGAPARAADDLTVAVWQGHVSTALANVQAKLDADPADYAARAVQIDVLTGIGYGKAAAADQQARVEAAPESADAWALLGRAEPTAEASLAALDRALSIDPTHAGALSGRSAVLRATGKAVAAVESGRAAVAADPSLAEAWTNLAQAWVAMGDEAQAVAAAGEAIQRAPHDPSVWLLHAALVPDSARETLARGAALHPRVPQLWTALGRARFETQDWDGAAEAYDKGLALGPPNAAEVRVERSLVDELRSGAIDMTGAAVILDIRGIAQHDPTLALAALNTLAEEQPRSGQVRLVYGNLLRALGNHGEAETQLKAARDLMPDDADAWMALGTFYLGQRRAADARPLLEQAARTRPGDPGLAVAAAVAAAEAGDVAAAEAALRSAQSRFPGSIGPVLGLARLLANAGRTDEALALLTDALRSSPQVELALALASTAKSAGKEGEVVGRLRALAAETGDPRLAAAADGLEQASSTASQPSP